MQAQFSSNKILSVLGEWDCMNLIISYLLKTTVEKTQLVCRQLKLIECIFKYLY